eukprot:4920203-Amphidinium_carterae.1
MLGRCQMLEREGDTWPGLDSATEGCCQSMPGCMVTCTALLSAGSGDTTVVRASFRHRICIAPTPVSLLQQQEQIVTVVDT